MDFNSYRVKSQKLPSNGVEPSKYFLASSTKYSVAASGSRSIIFSCSGVILKSGCPQKLEISFEKSIFFQSFFNFLLKFSDNLPMPGIGQHLPDPVALLLTFYPFWKITGYPPNRGWNIYRRGFDRTSQAGDFV